MKQENAQNNFKSLEVLKKIVDENGCCKVIQEGGYVWEANCSFNPPATKDEIAELKKQLDSPLPLSYEWFLLKFNGAVLFYDKAYGQWGFKLYGADNLIAKNTMWKKRYGSDWKQTYLAFAESFGDADLLVLDTAKLTKDGNDCAVID